MRATVMYAAGDVRIAESAGRSALRNQTDAVVRSHQGLYLRQRPMALSGRWSALLRVSEWDMRPLAWSRRLAPRYALLKRGDVVVMPFAISDGTCVFCQEGLPTACLHVGFFGNHGNEGAQAEAIRIPYADGTLVRPPGSGADDALMPSLLTLADVMGTGHHAAVVAKRERRQRCRGGGRWCRGPLWRHRGEAPGRGAYHSPRSPSRSHRARARIWRHRCSERTRCRGDRAPTGDDPRVRCARRLGVRWPRSIRWRRRLISRARAEPWAGSACRRTQQWRAPRPLSIITSRWAVVLPRYAPTSANCFPTISGRPHPSGTRFRSCR